MKWINEVFTEDEHKELSRVKKRSGLKWHDAIIEAFHYYDAALDNLEDN